MKTITLLRSTLLVVTSLLVSCTNDDEPITNNQDTNPSTSAFFAAKVDNQNFPKAEIKFTAAKFVTSTKMLQIIGQPEDQKETITLTLMPFGGKVNTPVDWKPGTYDFDPIHVTNVEYMASAEYNKWNGNGYDQWFTKWDYVKTGKIIIESNSGTQIKGTFYFDAVFKNTDGSFNASNIKKITEGTFNLEIKTL